MGRSKRATGTSEVSFSSTDAQNRFGEVLRLVQGGTRVVVELRGREEVVILPIQEYRSLEMRARSPLLELEERFDSMVARMRDDNAIEALDRALASGAGALVVRIPPADD